MVGIERLDGPADVVLVETRDGALADLGPVIRAALVVQARREANPSGVTAVLLGMRIAVGKVCGGEAATVFEEWVFGDR